MRIPKILLLPGTPAIASRGCALKGGRLRFDPSTIVEAYLHSGADRELDQPWRDREAFRLRFCELSTGLGGQVHPGRSVGS
jgi:hypothetical protein